MIRVAIVEDHELVRLGVKMVLARSRRYTVVAETARGKELESLVRQRDAQLVLLDLALSDGAGMDAAANLKQAIPSVKILIVTGDASSALVKDAFRAGADGFLLKEGKGEELLHAMDTVMAGTRYLSPRLGGAGVTPR
jgi:DNA-binding NarL/FixJ family response regulator